MKSIYLNLHEVIIVLAIIETLVLCLVLISMPAKNHQSRNFLCCFFLLVFGTLSTTLIIWNPSFQSTVVANYPIVPILLSVCLLLQGPALFYYLQSLTKKIDFRNGFHLLHFVLPILVAFVIFGFDISILDWLPWNWRALTNPEKAAIAFVWALVKCFPLFYVLACFYSEYRLRQQLQHQLSTISNWELRLADLVLGGFFVHWFWSFITYFLGEHLGADMNDTLGILNNYLTVILINGLFLFAWLNTRPVLQNEWALKSGNERDRMQDIVDLEDKIASVEDGISVQKLHLDNRINLDRFAEQIGIKSRVLSTILNDYYQQNFFEFINVRRIEEAKRLLTSSENAQDTILDVIYKSGFNSQSAFHRFFKRIVGMSPSQYRNQHLKY
jgi:AraC-like DNA-binding protein